MHSTFHRFATLQLQYVKDVNKLPYEINAQKHHFRQCIQTHSNMGIIKFTYYYATIELPYIFHRKNLMYAPLKKKTKGKSRQTKGWHWGAKQDKAFETLKTHLVSAAILGYKDSTLPYELHTDASGDSIRAVLYREQTGSKHFISYAKRGLNIADKYYPPYKREFLALKWAICTKIKDYLYGQQFSVLTDNNSVT